MYIFILFNICTIFQALFCIDRSLSVALASRTLKVSRAEVLAYLGRYREAREIARKDIKSTDATYIRGLCLCYEDSVDKAFTHFSASSDWLLTTRRPKIFTRKPVI